jgi:hypothetical protein
MSYGGECFHFFQYQRNKLLSDDFLWKFLVQRDWGVRDKVTEVTWKQAYQMLLQKARETQSYYRNLASVTFSHLSLQQQEMWLHSVERHYNHTLTQRLRHLTTIQKTFEDKEQHIKQPCPQGKCSDCWWRENFSNY